MEFANFDLNDLPSLGRLLHEPLIWELCVDCGDLYGDGGMFRLDVSDIRESWLWISSDSHQWDRVGGMTVYQWGHSTNTLQIPKHAHSERKASQSSKAGPTLRPLYVRKLSFMGAFMSNLSQALLRRLEHTSVL